MICWNTILRKPQSCSVFVALLERVIRDSTTPAFVFRIGYYDNKCGKKLLTLCQKWVKFGTFLANNCAVCCGDTMGYMYFFTPRRCESTQKIMYANKGQALMAADKSLRERGARLWVYKCDYCGSWHLTHSNPAIRKYCDMRSRFETTKPKSRKRGYKPRIR